MLERLCPAALLAALLVVTANAGAEPASAAKAAEGPEARRDPHGIKGIKGISPFNEALRRGDIALLAHDIEAAIVAYREAIAKEPENALGQYRLGEAQVLKGDLSGAEAALGSGLRVVDPTNLALKAKLQFAWADLRERQKAYDEATAKWTEYEAFTSAQKSAQGFPASGAERKKVVLAWQKLSADSLAVKARIEKGLRAADEAVKKNSK